MRKTDKLDIVYVVKPDADNEELRYSLRSLRNIPHKNVWIIGGCPDWVQNVHVIERDQMFKHKWVNVNENLEAACNCKEISANFILFNDDFFVMKKIEGLEDYYEGTLYEKAEQIESDGRVSDYTLMLKQASDKLEEKGLGVLNYELHVPMIFNKKKLLEVLKDKPVPACRRSYYGNMFLKNSVEMRDVKGYKPNDVWNGSVFYSTADEAFRTGICGIMIRKMFNEVCEYERPKNEPRRQTGYPDSWWWKWKSGK